MKTTLTILLITFAVSVSAQKPVFQLLFNGNGVDSSGNAFPGHFGSADSTFSATTIEGTHSWDCDYGEHWISKSAYNLDDRIFTISANVYWGYEGGTHALFTNRENAGMPGIDVRIDAQNHRFYGRTSNGSISNDFYGGAYSNNIWMHLVFIFNGQYVRIFQNGVKLTLTDSTILSDYDVNKIISIGMWADGATGDFADGRIDNFQLYDYAVSSAQADSLYDNRTTNFILGNAGSGSIPQPEGYSPVAGRHVWPTSNGVRKIPSKNGVPVYFKRKGSPILEGDSIRYYIFEDFETWSTSDFASATALHNKWEYRAINVEYDQQTIVSDGAYGNVWNSQMYQDEWRSFAAELSIDTAVQDLWVSYDMKLDPNFTPPLLNAHKSTMVLEAGNDFTLTLSYTTPPIIDTSGVGSYARGAIFQTVGGSSSQFAYTYCQDRNDGSSWINSVATADSGYYPLDPGNWHRYTVHLNTGTPGKAPGYYDGFGEVYRDGIMVARYSGLKFRSLAQQQYGYPFGLIETVGIFYFFGGSETSGYASPISQYCRFDNIAVYEILPTAKHYSSGPRLMGSTIPEVKKAGSFFRGYGEILADETYTAASDTIFDVGNGRGYIYTPPDDYGYVTKVVQKPSGTISYTFLTEEFGYPEDEAGQSYWVKVYSGTGESKVLQKIFGRTDAGYENPSGVYNTGTQTATFEIHTGWRMGVTRGVAIRYY